MTAWLPEEGLGLSRVALSLPVVWARGFWKVVLVGIWLLGPGRSQKWTTCDKGHPSGLRSPWVLDRIHIASLYFLIFFYYGKNS